MASSNWIRVRKGSITGRESMLAVSRAPADAGKHGPSSVLSGGVGEQHRGAFGCLFVNFSEDHCGSVCG